MKNTTLKPDFGKIIAVREFSEEDVRVTYTLFESAGDEQIYSVVLETESNGTTEVARAYDIRRNRHEAEEIFGILAGGGVTSCCLFEILDEIL